MPGPPDPGRLWAVAATGLAALTVVGSVGLTWVLGLKPCPLCFYQRAFAMGLLGLFAVGWLSGVRGSALCALGLPMVVGGLGVAGFHVWLELSGKLDCPAGFLGLGTAPKQSLVAFVALTVAVVGGALQDAVGAKVLGAATALGLAFAYASCKANGPPPAPVPHPEKLTVCMPHWEPPGDSK